MEAAVTAPSNLKRSANFSKSEESLLIYLAKKYKKIIENKKSDSNANRQKTSCWVEIEKEFNTQNGSNYRSADVLRRKYENIKKRTKTKISEEKCFRFKTGGGPHKDFKFTDVEESVMELLGKTRVEGEPTEFGGDAPEYQVLEVQEEVNETPSTIENILIEYDIGDCEMEAIEGIQQECEEESFSDLEKSYQNKDSVTGTPDLTNIENAVNKKILGEKENWSKYTPELLKKPKSKVLKPVAGNKENMENSIPKKISQWASIKSKVEEGKQKFLQEEHETKLRLLIERHNTEMELVRAESKARILKIEEEKKVVIETLKEEQKLKKEILELQKIKLLRELKK